MQTKVVVKSEDIDFDRGCPIVKCTCGAIFSVYGVFPERPTECYQCGRKYYWTPRVYMLVEDTDNV